MDNQHVVSESKINIGDVPDLVIKLIEKAYGLIADEDYIDALHLLKECEDLLEAVKSQGGYTDLTIVYLVFNNMAMGFQKLDLDQAC